MSLFMYEVYKAAQNNKKLEENDVRK